MIVLLPGGFSVDPEEVKVVRIRADSQRGKQVYEVVLQTDSAGAVVIGRRSDRGEAEGLVEAWWRKLNKAKGDEDEGPEVIPWPTPAVVAILERLAEERAARESERPLPAAPIAAVGAPALDRPSGQAWSAWCADWLAQADRLLRTGASGEGMEAIVAPAIAHLRTALAGLEDPLEADDLAAARQVADGIRAHVVVRALQTAPGELHRSLDEALSRVLRPGEQDA